MQIGALPTELVWVPPLVEFGNMKPGDREVQTFRLTNANDVPIQLSSIVTRTGDVFEGHSPLEVGFELSASGRCTENPQAIPPHSTVVATMKAELPLATGNEYQGRSGSATLTVTATEAPVCGSTTALLPPTETLPTTGADPAGLLMAAIVCVSIGAAIRWRATAKRRRSRS